MTAPTPLELIEQAARHLDAGELDAALAAADQGIALDASLAAAHATRALVLLRRDEDYDALVSASRAVQLDPNCADGHTIRAHVFLGRGDFRQASAEADLAIASGQGDAMAFGVRADARLRLGDAAGALADADEVMRLDSRPEYRAQAQMLRAAALEMGGNHEGALAEAHRAVAECADAPAAVRANLLIVRGRMLRARGELDAALADAEAAVQLAPENADAHVSRASVRLDSGDFRGAIVDAEAALGKAADHFRALYVRGSARRRLGDFDGAVADLSALARQMPNDRDVTEELRLARGGERAFAPSAVHRAIGHLREGHGAAAEEHLLQTVADALGQYGPNSLEYMEALNGVASIYLLSHQYDKAADAWGKACSVRDPGNEQLTRSCLTYTMDWAEALEKAGRADEAEKVLRDALTGRVAFYGRDHAGYAFGLMPLAALLSRRDKHDEALALLDEALANFWKNQHERYFEAQALHARIAAAANQAGNVFNALDGQDLWVVERVAKAVADIVARGQPEAADRRLTRDLVAWLEKRFGAEHQLTVSAVSFVSVVEKELGDHAARVVALRRLLAWFESQGNAQKVAHTLINLAEAQDQNKQPEEAERTFRDAVARADELHSPADAAWARDRFGAFLGRSGRAADAVPVLREAVALARQGGDAATLGQAMVSLGIVVQHGGGLEEARGLLTEGLGLLPAGHAYFLIGRNHLQAIETQGACGCGDAAATVAVAFRDFLMAQFPPDFQPRLEVEYVDNEFTVRAYVDNAEPTAEQNERLARAVAHARAEFFRRAGGR